MTQKAVNGHHNGKSLGELGGIWTALLRIFLVTVIPFFAWMSLRVIDNSDRITAIENSRFDRDHGDALKDEMAFKFDRRHDSYLSQAITRSEIKEMVSDYAPYVVEREMVRETLKVAKSNSQAIANLITKIAVLETTIESSPRYLLPSIIKEPENHD